MKQIEKIEEITQYAVKVLKTLKNHSFNNKERILCEALSIARNHVIMDELNGDE